MGGVMPGFVLILFFLCLFRPDWAFSEEMLIGTIVTVDTGKETFVLRPLGNTDAAWDIHVNIPPKCPNLTLEPGVKLRVWGDFHPGSDNRFAATSIARGDSCGRGSDQTGVRRRLMQGRCPSSGCREGPCRGSQ
jgi:hypothetical protein